MQCGTGWCTLYLDNSIERVVHQFSDGTLKILYKNSFYPLHEPSELEKIVREHLALKGGIHIPGGTIHYNDKNLKFTPFHFINVTSKAEAENYSRLRPIWIASKEFIGENGEGAGTIESEQWEALSQNQKMQI